MSEPLYKIKQEYLSAINGLIEQDNDIDYQCISDTLTAIKDEFDNKVINIASYLKNMDIEIKTMRQYEGDMRRRRETREKKFEAIHKYLRDNLIESGITHVSGDEFTVALHRSPPSLQIENEELIPGKYKSEKTTFIIDKKQLKEDLINGEVVEKATLKRGFYLKIK